MSLCQEDEHDSFANEVIDSVTVPPKDWPSSGLATITEQASGQAHDGSSQEKSSRRPEGELLIHSYRLAPSDSQAGPCHPVSTRVNTVKRRRTVSFDLAAPKTIPASAAAPRRSARAPTATPVNVSGERKKEYRVFLGSVTSVTLFLMVLQPLVLFYCLVQCQEPRCYNVAIAVHHSIAPSVEPCQDFFNYSCGDGGAARYFARIEQSMRLSALRSVAAVPVPRWHQSAVQKAAMLLSSCLKLTMQSSDDVDIIRNVLSAGGLSFPKMPDTTKYDTIQSIVAFNFNAGIATLFRVTAGRSVYSGNGYMLYVTPSYDVVSFAEYLLQLGSSENFETFVRRCAEVIGERSMSYAILIRAVKGVNQVVSDLSVTNPLQVELKLSTSYPQTGFWNFLSVSLHKKLEFFNISKRTFLVVDDDYFSFVVSNVFEPLEAKHITAYIGLYLVWYMSRLASYTLAYSSPVPNFTHHLKDLWLRCYADVHMLMPFAVERLYLHETIDKRDLDEIQGIVQRVTQATKKFVKTLPREGRPSEERLIEKIGKLRLFPYTFASLYEPAQLDRMYAHVPDQKDVDYVYNFLRMSRMTAHHMVRLLTNSSADTTEPFVPPFEAGVPYMASVYNMIHLRPDVMLPPSFTYGQSLSLNYAGLGYNVAEQVTELFLRSPRLLNETGGYGRVWSERFFNSVRRKYQCLRDVFVGGDWDTNELPRAALRASVTAEIVFNAFMEARHSPAHAARFKREKEHFGLPPEKLFFVGLCINWSRRRHEPRGLDELVCRFSMPSLRSFNEVFSCKNTTVIPVLNNCLI